VTLIAWHVEASAGQLTLTWIGSSTNELGSSIERSTGTAGAFGEIGTTGPSVTAYTDLTVADGTTYCYRVRAFDAIAYSGYSNVACATVAQTFGLAVVKIGAGSGTVMSVPAGISCGTSCSGSYATGTAVTLTARPATGSTFTGWSGGGCSGTGTCTVTVMTTTTVTATFALQSEEPPLTVTLSLNETTFSNGDGLTLSADVHVNFDFPNPVDAYLDVQDPFGSIHPVGSYVNANMPSVGFSGVVAAGTLTGVSAGTYTLWLVLVKAGGDPQNLADRLSNFASISFIVQ
jgi:hypothetical protein